MFSELATERTNDSLPTCTSPALFQTTGSSAFVRFATQQIRRQNTQMKRRAVLFTESQVTTAVLPLLLDREEKKEWGKAERRGKKKKKKNSTRK